MNSVPDKADSFLNVLQMTIRPRMRCQGCSLISSLPHAVITNIDLWKSFLIPIIIRRPRKSLSKYCSNAGTQRFKTWRCCRQRMVIETAWRMGLTSSVIPEDCGGPGGERSAITGALIAEELAWGDLSMAMHILCPALFASPILELGTESQRKKYLPLFSDEKYKAATAGLIEPRFGFDPYSLSTTARLDGHGYVLNGEKSYVPLAAEADLLIVYAAENGTSHAYIVERDTKGLEIGEREQNMGIRALATYELRLRNCHVPKENRLGDPRGYDFGGIMNCSRVALSAMAVGVAKAAMEYSRDYAKERVAFGG